MWEQIRSNQTRSVVLVTAMGIFFLGIGYLIGQIFFDNPIAGLVIAALVWGFMYLIALFQGDSILLGMSGAHKVGPDDHPQLYNVVEEMKIASGLEKMPDVYIIDDPALNAFSTGRSPDHASVAITSGLLSKLNRDELQAVIGHEVGHIKNRDIRLMLLASVMLGAIVLLAYFATRMLFLGGLSGGRRGSSRDGGGLAQVVILVIGLVLLILAPIIAQIIYFAISRRREYLADASSAIYTRYPEGLASALEKLQDNNTQVKAANKATAPLYISNPFYKKGMAINDLFATHPPLADRIRILRAMAGAGYADYEKAYEQVTKAKVMPASALALDSIDKVQKRAATSGTQAGDVQDRVDRTRQTSDLMWRMNNYKTITCRNCGTVLRLPPSYNQPAVRCPHCGFINEV